MNLDLLYTFSEVCKTGYVWQNLDYFVVSNESTEVSARHTEMPNDVRELWVFPYGLSHSFMQIGLLSRFFVNLLVIFVRQITVYRHQT